MNPDYNKEAVRLFDQYAERYAEKYMDVSLYGESLKDLCSLLISTEPAILELASGPGNIAKYILSLLPHAQYLATDLSSKMLNLAKVYNPTVSTKIFDGRELDKIIGSFDAIIAGFYLPYINKDDLGQVIRAAYDILNINGVIYLSGNEGDYADSGYASNDSANRLFMYKYRLGHIAKILKGSGFKVYKKYRFTHNVNEDEIAEFAIIGIKQSAKV